MKDFHQECGIACRLQYTNPEDVSVSPHSNGTNMIVFEGSDTWSNWICNLNLRTTSIGAHRGFWKYAHWCVRKYDLLRLFRENDELILTGHSLGAAAAIMVRYIMRHQSTRVHLVLFGCPKVGTSLFRTKFSKVINESSVSFCNPDDPVPCLPCGFCVKGYTHVLDIEYLPMNIRETHGHAMQTYCESNIPKS